MKNIFKTLSVFSLVMALLSPQSAQSALGVTTGNPVLIGVGAALVATAATAFTVTTAVCNTPPNCGYDRQPLLTMVVVDSLSIVAFVTGIALLRQDSALEFQRDLSQAQAAMIGLSATEMSAFNQRRSDINVMFQDVAEQLNSLPNATPADSLRLWRESADLYGFSDVERHSLAKVAQYLMRQAGLVVH